MPEDKGGTGVHNLLTIKQLAERLNVSVSALYKKTCLNEIPFIRLGTGKKSPLRFDVQDIDKWLEERKVKAIIRPWQRYRKFRS